MVCFYMFPTPPNAVVHRTCAYNCKTHSSESAPFYKVLTMTHKHHQHASRFLFLGAGSVELSCKCMSHSIVSRTSESMSATTAQCPLDFFYQQDAPPWLCPSCFPAYACKSWTDPRSFVNIRNVC